MRIASRVGVAEDNPDMRGLIADALRKAGHSVVELEDGGALLREIEAPTERRLDLVVSDIRMPNASGLSVLRFLRASGSTMPVVLMTAFGDESIQRETLMLHAVLFSKPFKIAELCTIVRVLLDWSNR